MTARITTLDEFEKEYEQGIGEPIVPRAWRRVSQEWLFRYGTGAGDFNPLFREPEYAAGSARHGLTAAPGFIFSIDFGANASIWGHIPESRVSMHDLTILYLGNRAEWYRPIRVGDEIRSIETPIGVKRVEMRQTGEALVCTGQTEYWNSRGELVARLENDMLRFVNTERPVESAYDDQTDRVAPDPLVWQRQRRGAETLWWDDVVEGEEIPPLPKGTYTTSELYLFSYLALGGSRSKAVDEGTIDMGAGGRADPEYARKSRAQAASFDYGPQRTCCLLQAVTDWAGDAGTVVSSQARLRRPNIVGDTNRVSGRVVRRFRDPSGEPLVEVEVANTNQRDEVTASASVTVRLPAKDEPATVPPLLWGPVRQEVGGIYN